MYILIEKVDVFKNIFVRKGFCCYIKLQEYEEILYLAS